MTGIGTIHFALSLTALLSGGIVLWQYKGTRLHRWLGYTYAVTMSGVVITSLLMFNLTGRFNVLHVFALVAAMTLGAGMFAVRVVRPKTGWLEHHAAWMAWSYLGLVGAFVAETLTRFAMPLLIETLEQQQLVGAFWMLVGIATALTMGVGSLVIKRRLPASIAKTRG